MISNEPGNIDIRIAVESLDQLFNRIVKEVLTNFIVPVVVLLVMWQQVEHVLLITWFVLMSIGIVVNYLIAKAYLRQDCPIINPVKWGRRMSAVMLYFGLLWVYAIFLFYVDDSVGHQVFIIAIAIVFSLGSVMVGLYWFPMFYLLAVPVISALIIRFALEGTFEYISLSILMLWTLLVSGFMAKMLNKTVYSEMRLRHESSALAEQLHVKIEEAENATQAKSRFLASASHDLRQPLHALMLNATILDERCLDDENAKVIGNITNSVQSLEGLFNALLDISKLDAGTITPNLIHFKLQTVLDRLKVDCLPLSEEKDLSLDIPVTDICLYSDPALLERILRNLISNGIRYTESGAVGLEIEPDADMVKIKVIDTGVGINKENIKKIFEEFVQLDNPERDRGKGLGLGLSIVDRLCNLLDCTVLVESSLDSGSIFYFSIPLGDEKLVSEQAEANISFTPKPLNYFVVIIDDEKSIRDGLQNLLESWSCTVLAFCSEEEAIAKLKEYEYPPDVLLVDYRLRENKTGIEAITTINKLFNENIPALIITGDTASDRLEEAEKSGYQLLHKPLHPSKLRVFLHNISAK